MKRFPLFAVGAALGVPILSGPATAAILLNGNFASATSNGYPKHWQGSGNVTVTNNGGASAFHPSSRAVVFQPTHGQLLQTFQVVAGESYQISGYFKNSNSLSTFAMEAGTLGGASGHAGGNTVSPSFQRQAFDFQAKNTGTA